MTKKIVVTYHQLGCPTEPGEFSVSGLGRVVLTERDIETWRESGFRRKMKLIESSSIAQPGDRWQFIRWVD